MPSVVLNALNDVTDVLITGVEDTVPLTAIVFDPAPVLARIISPLGVPCVAELLKRTYIVVLKLPLIELKFVVKPVLELVLISKPVGAKMLILPVKFAPLTVKL